MNKELMTMGLVSRSRKNKGRTYRYNQYYKNRDGKWMFYSSATVPNSTLDKVRKEAVRELHVWSESKVIVTDEAGRELGTITNGRNGYPVWTTRDGVYNLSTNTGKISPLTTYRRA